MKKAYIWIGLLSIAIGIVIAFQTKYVQGTYLEGLSATQSKTQLLNQLELSNLEQENLEEELGKLQEQYDLINENAAEENVIIKNLNSELEYYKKIAGMTDVQGQGLIIKVDNPPVELSFQYELNISNEYILVLQMINELNAAGAEAISINGQRIIGRTEVRLAGSSVNVNSVAISPPYIIRCIGNSETLEGAITQKYGIVKDIQERGYYVDVVNSENVEIPKYSGVTKFNYASTYKD